LDKIELILLYFFHIYEVVFISNNKKYSISIIIPTFNVEKTIDAAFNSILNQTIGFENLEIIFVDDNSNDRTKKIIECYSKNYPNVLGIFLSSNSGFPGRPRNVGIKNSTAEHIMFLDADDLYFEDACENLYKKIKTANCDLVSGNFIQIKNKKEIIKEWDYLNLKNKEIRINDISEKLDLFKVAPSVWTKIYKKSFLDKNQLLFEENLPAEDLIFVTSALIKSRCTIFLDKPIYFYIERDYSTNLQKAISDDNRKEQLSNYLKAYELSYNSVKDYFINQEPIFIFNHLVYWLKLLKRSEIKYEDKIDLLNESYNILKKFEDISRDVELECIIKDLIIVKEFEKALKYLDCL